MRRLLAAATLIGALLLGATSGPAGAEPVPATYADGTQIASPGAGPAMADVGSDLTGDRCAPGHHVRHGRRRPRESLTGTASSRGFAQGEASYGGPETTTVGIEQTELPSEPGTVVVQSG